MFLAYVLTLQRRFGEGRNLLIQPPGWFAIEDVFGGSCLRRNDQRGLMTRGGVMTGLLCPDSHQRFKRAFIQKHARTAIDTTSIQNKA